MQCQNCKTPIRPDSSLEKLGQPAISLLLDATNSTLQNVPPHLDTSRPLYSQSHKAQYETAIQESKPAAIRRQVGPPRNQSLGKDNKADMSFIMLTESQIVPQTGRDEAGSPKSSKVHSSTSAGQQDKLSFKAERINRLFEVLSSRSDIDHPICVECTEMLLDGFEKRLANTQKETADYSAFLRSLKADVPTDDELKELDEQLAKLRQQEEDSMAALEAAEAEHALLQQQILEAEQESRLLDQQEEDFWRERNDFVTELRKFSDERDSLNLRYEHDAALLEQLQRTNVYNDTFNISYDGYFGTINGLRLGRMSGSTVEWAEVNAAWGQACLLLATIAERLNFQFQGYRLKPLGSTSTIDKIDLPQRASSSGQGQTQKVATTTSLSLFYSSDLPINIGFLHRHFDSAMIAFLECIRQLGKHVERTTQGTQSGGENGLQLPYEIKKDRINDCSIKLSGFGGDESWTKACKFTLTCCKVLLAHASNISSLRS